MTLLRILIVASIVLLAACEVPDAQFGECEPGVGDLSRIETVLPTC